MNEFPCESCDATPLISIYSSSFFFNPLAITFTSFADMDEAMLKRNTDCIFFLASPLTCKKGMECEYRHSEVARLNLRDCWYWSAGNCLNTACGFRHPPLDLQNEPSSEPTVSTHQSSTTVKKTIVPCYFYYSGFCSKGNGCSFSHGPYWFSPPNGKSLKNSSAVTGGPLLKNDAIVRKATGSDPRERKLSLSRTFPKVTAQCGRASDNVLKLSEPPEISVAKIEVASVEGSGSFFQAGLTLERPHISTNQSLEERGRASPGFHVSANGNNSENLYYEDDQEEYIPPYVQHEEEINSPLSGYDLKEPSAYDPMDPHAQVFREYRVYDSWKNSKSAHSLDNAGIVQDDLSGRASEFLSSTERDLLHREVEVGDCPNLVDLRDCLNTHRGHEGHSASWLLRRHNSSCSSGYRHARLGRNRFSQRLQKKLTALVRKNPVGSVQNYGFSLNVVRNHGVLRHSRVQSFRKHKGKRQLYATRVSKSSFPRGNRSNGEESAAFAGPKTLDQIKKERIRAET